MEYSLVGFHLYCLCRERKKGEGLLMFINDSCLSERINASLDHAELCAISVHKSSISYIACAVYQPPNSNIKMFCEELSPLLRQFDNNQHIILAGDFNIDVLNENKYG